MVGNVEKKKLLDKNEIFEGLNVGQDLPVVRTFWMTMEYYHQHGKMHWIMKAFAALGCLLSVTYNGSGILAVFTVDMAYKRWLSAIMSPLIGLQATFKLWVFMRNLPDHIKTFDFLKPHYLNSVPEETTERARAVYNRNTAAINRFVKYAMFSNALALVMVHTMPYLRSQWLRETLHVGQGAIHPNKVVENEYPFEWNYTPMYQFILFYEHLGAILLMTVMALVGHLKVLGYVLETMKGTDFTRDGQPLDRNAQEKAYQALIKCVTDHQKLVKAGDFLAERYNTFLTWHLSTAIVVSVIAIFQFNLADDVGDSFKYLVMCIYGLMEVALYCFCGQMLENASEELLRQAYHCEWEEMSPKFRKATVLLMVRAKTSLSLTAGRLYPVNFETMANIQQLIYTCLTMLTTAA